MLNGTSPRNNGKTDKALGAHSDRMNNGKLKHSRDPVAIIGMGCRFPGQANDAQSFWRLLCNKVDAVGEIPADRWNIDAYYDAIPGVPGKTYSRWGGFVKDIDAFEPECFGISPREAGHMDPQQRMLLEVSREALEDAALAPERLSGIQTGVFVGISTYDYAQMHYGPAEWSGVDPHSATGGASSIAANRISYCLNLQGPSIAVDTACSSSLVAIDLACRSLWDGECAVALAGGVNAIISPGPYIAFCAATMLSPEGRCKTFDANANGFVRGEGAGIIVLKSLERALADGDPIYALIAGTAVNHDGRTSGIALPSETAQEALVRAACQAAGIDPREIDYVEAHGTGTAVGDPIEARALGTVLCGDPPRETPLLVGSAKTNVGHLEAGAGIVGVIKTALSLQHRLIPPNLHFKTPNPSIPFKELRLRVPCEVEPWPQDTRPAVAGVNSFGFGGTNAHVVMIEHAGGSAPAQSTNAQPGPWLMTLSARTPEALRAEVEGYRSHLGLAAGPDAPALKDACYTTQTGRGHYEHRLALAIEDREALDQGLTAYLDDERRPWMAAGRRETSGAPPLAFVFAGQGPQWWGMGRQLLAAEPVFRQTIEAIDALMAQQAPWSLIEELSAPECESRIHKTEFAQPALFALEVGLADLWRSWGIRPDAVIGHSVGEIAAAHVCGVLDLADAIKVIFHRGRCMERASSKGQMLAVGLTEAAAEQAIQGYAQSVSLAAVNGPASATLSGEPEALEEIRRGLAEEGVFCRFLQVDYAFHSSQMNPVRQPLLSSLKGLEPGAAVIKMISTVTGQTVEGRELTSEYWWRNVRHTVRFSQAIDQLLQEGYGTFLELGPHPVLAAPISECLQQRRRKGLLLPSLRRDDNEKRVMLASLGSLYTRGYAIEWPALWAAGARRVRLPVTPWNRRSYWQESDGSRAARLGPARHPLLGHRLGTADPTWESRIDLRALPYLQDHRVQGHVVMPATAYVEMALAAAAELLGTPSCVVEELRFHKALILDEAGGPTPLQFSLHPADGSFAIHSRTGSSDEAWMLHATGTVQAQTREPPTTPTDLKAVQRSLSADFAPADLYSVVAEFELDYGPSFRGLNRLWRSDGEALGRISLPSHLASDSGKYQVHPALLDACYQVLVAAYPLAEGKKNRNLYLPVYFRRIDFFGNPGHSVWSHLELTSVTNQALEGNFRVCDGMGRVLLEIHDFHCQAAQEVRLEYALERWFYEVRWHDQPTDTRARERAAVDYIPHPSKLAGRIELRQNIDIGAHSAADNLLDRLAITYMARGLEAINGPMAPEKLSRARSHNPALPIKPAYRALSQRFLQILRESDSFPLGSRAGDDPNQLWPAALSQFPSHLAELTVLGRCGSRLRELLQGNADPDELLASSAMDHWLNDSPSFHVLNEYFRNVVKHWLANLPDGRSLRILELGAGLGGVTANVIPVLPRNRSEYVVTDSDQRFLDKAQQKFRAYPFVKYSLLDLDQDPRDQGFEPQGFDLILGAQSLLVSAGQEDALARVRRLLAPGGVLAVQAWDEPRIWHELVFGILQRPWASQICDGIAPSPQVRTRTRKQLLKTAGYTAIAIRPGDRQSMILARNPLSEAIKNIQDAPAKDVVNSETTGSWLVFEDQEGVVADQIATFFSAKGQRCTRVRAAQDFRALGDNTFTLRPDNPDDMDRLVESMQGATTQPFRGAIHLWNLDTPPATTLSVDALREAEVLGCHTLMHLLQSLDRTNDSNHPMTLGIVTAGAQPVGNGDTPIALAASPALGLGRVIVNEYPGIRCKLIDLSTQLRPSEIDGALAELLNERDEEEIAFRHQSRFVPRLERATSERVVIPPRRSRQANSAFRLSLSAPGIIENLTLKQCTRHSPGPGQVEIAVHAAALNFRDVMKTLGLYPTDAGDSLILGDECSGRIVRIGKEVTNLKAGDEVMAIAPSSLGSHVITLAAATMPKPEGVSFAAAATLPVAFATAYYALHHLAHIQLGDKVLIHAAAGGVGLAAVQIAQRFGLDIFATAGSPEKREFLRLMGVPHIMDSRSLVFADEIMDATNGVGVDVVLNSLAGQAIAKGVSCLAPHGRFLEIGKRDIYENNKLGLSAFRKNLSFFAIDLGSLMVEKPGTVAAMLAELSQEFSKGTLRPLPHRVFAAPQMTDAFRYMAQARQVGKVVVGLRDVDVTVAAAPRKPLAFRADATYLVTGGFGGMGRTLAQWLLARGARNIVLVGRRGSGTPGAQETLKELRRGNARVLGLKADVSDPTQLRRVLRRIEKDLPPLRGIFHTAMVLDDGVLLQLDSDRFHRVMAPKARGAWNLHQETLGCALDFFTLFSSISSLVGSPGQANYVAANAFLDSLASYRKSLGLPVLTINWGHLAGTGYVAEHAELGESLTRRGILGISPEEAMQALDTLLQRNPGQMGVMRIDWNKLGNTLSQVHRAQRLSSLVHQDTEPGVRNPEEGTRELIVTATGDERRSLLTEHIANQVARVMGTVASQLDMEAPLRDLGLDSLMAVEMRNHIEGELRLSLPTAKLMQTTVNVVTLVDVVLDLLGPGAPATPERNQAAQNIPKIATNLNGSQLVALRSEGTQPPLFCIHPAEGDVRIYRSLAQRLPVEQPVYGVQPHHHNGADLTNGRALTIAQMAAEYATIIQSKQPSGSYSLLGFSLGGLIAVNIASILEHKGKQVGFLGLVDCDLSWADPNIPQERLLGDFIIETYTRLDQELGVVKPIPMESLLEESAGLSKQLLSVPQELYLDTIMDWLTHGSYLTSEITPSYVKDFLVPLSTHISLIQSFRAAPLQASIAVWWAGKSTLVRRTKDWCHYTTGAVVEATLDATHSTVMQPPHVDIIAEHVGKSLLTG